MVAPDMTIAPLSVAPFAPLELSLEDRLEIDLQLVLGHRQRIDPERLKRAVGAGLESFPHLAGRLEHGDRNWRIVPARGEVQLERVEDGGRFAMADLEAMPAQELAERFLPGKSVPDDGDRGLFRLRWTRCGGGDVLGLRVSHAAVDGAGLGWFARCCAAGARGIPPPHVSHDRHGILTTAADGLAETPAGYREIAARPAGWQWPPDPWVKEMPQYFMVPAGTARKVTGMNGSLLETRLALSAWLCGRLSEIAPSLTMVAVWCDPRGGGLVPRHFTGNAGCYHTLPLRGKPLPEVMADLKQLAGRAGLRRTAELHRSIKSAEADGRMVVWDGPRNDLLQLNLLPRAVESGPGGPPDFSRLLSRNSSGLRVSVMPGGSGFLIEASLATGCAMALVEEAHRHGLAPVVRNPGEDPKYLG